MSRVIAVIAVVALAARLGDVCTVRRRGRRRHLAVGSVKRLQWPTRHHRITEHLNRPPIQGARIPSEPFVKRLNEQIGNEFSAQHQYGACAIYYDALTMPQMAALFYDQAAEERGPATR